MATDFSQIWNTANYWNRADEPWIPTTHKAYNWPDASRLFTAEGKVQLALVTRHAAQWTADTWWLPLPPQPTVEQLTVKFQGYVFYKHGINVTFVFRGEESEPVFVPIEQVTQQGLLKAADAFLIELDL